MSSRSSITSRARPRDFLKSALRFGDSRQPREQANDSPERKAQGEPIPGEPKAE